MSGRPGPRPIFLLLSIFCVGCSPVQQYYMKEKVIVGAPRPGVQVDRFAFGKAIGNVDVLFVVDNTESGEAAADAFRRSYTDFISRFGQPDARQLNYHLQVVSTPRGLSPENWTSSEQDSSTQLAQLFTGTPGGRPALLNYSDQGHLNPYEAATLGLAGKAYEQRGRVPLFLVFLLGHDADPSTTPAKDAQTFSEVIRQGRGFHQTHVSVLSRTSSLGNTSFPRCSKFTSSTRLLPTLQSLPWRSQAQWDLCDTNWPTSYPAELFSALIDFKKKLVLSNTPYQPETMLLRSSKHLFRYGDDYRFDAQKNEIIFIRDSGLQEGDLLDVSYYLKPNEELLPNGQTPPGPPALPPAHE